MVPGLVNPAWLRLDSEPLVPSDFDGYCVTSANDESASIGNASLACLSRRSLHWNDKYYVDTVYN